MIVSLGRDWTLGAAGAALLTCLATLLSTPSAVSAADPLRILPPTSLDWTQFRSQSPPASYLLLTGTYTSPTQASNACADLNEKLADVTDAVQDDNLRRHLAYLVYEGVFPANRSGDSNDRRTDSIAQMLWASRSNLFVLSSNSDGTDAKLKSAPQSSFRSGTLNLPALCTNSAPWNTVNSTDTSPTWRVSVSEGSVGLPLRYRDLLGFRFGAIPYAEPPARFEHSVPLISDQSVHAELGNSFSALRTTRDQQCPQTSGTTYDYSEDGCLLLNIATGWLPNVEGTGTKPPLRPILFWIHGGGLTSGAGIDGTFDGTGLSARNDIVVITPNYRLGTLGWLAVSDNTSPGLVGNFGLGDIISALKWVRAHAATFGGDPDRISIAGQSSGGWIVQLLLQSAEAEGLFESAAVMSGRPWDQANRRLSRAEAEKPSSAGGANGLAVLDSLGCSPSQFRRQAKTRSSHRSSSDPVLDCLRQLPTAKFLTSSVFAKPVRDGSLIKGATIDLSSPLSAAGHVNRVPLLLGTMRDELGSLGAVPAVGTSLEDALSKAGVQDPQKAAVVSNTNYAFPLSQSGRDAVQNLTVTVETDITSVNRCGLDSCLKLINDNNVFPVVHAYEFSSRAWQIPNFDPNAACAPNNDDELHSGQYFLCHSGEMMAVFGSAGFMYDLSPRDGNDLDWIRSISDAWAAFVRSGGRKTVMEPGYASLRGYGDSRKRMARWKSLGQSEGEVALLGADGVEDVRTLGEGGVGRRCSALGFGINYIRSERDD
ncbi:unnamed protein product [Tilletia controversa]|nr:unnamed protein product [Tilletia controversa]